MCVIYVNKYKNNTLITYINNRNYHTQVLYILTWAFVASYYFAWGSSQPSVPVASVDESGWSPDGTLANEIIEGITE